MKNLPLLLASIIGTIALIVVVAVFFSGQTQTTEVDQNVVAGSARLVKGGVNATVTLVEFSDFQCPACRAIQPLVQQVVKAYPDQVRLIFRHYPLTQIHQHALLAAQATEVAADAGKFWEMHDVLFEKQTEWDDLKSTGEAKNTFASYAEQLGIDKATFLAKIESEEIKKRVADDIALGNSIKIQATPTIFINGRQLTAPQQLVSTVESLLK